MNRESTTQNREDDPFPRILSMSSRLTPDHSGDICPICGCGGGEYIPYCESEDCIPWIDEATYRFAKSQYGMSPHHDPNPCENCIFEVRPKGGHARYLCWACIVHTIPAEQIAQMRECPECLIFQEFDGEQCPTCEQYGPLWGRYHARGERDLEPDEQEFLDRLFMAAMESPECGWETISFFQEEEGISDDLVARLEGKQFFYSAQCGARKQWITYAQTWFYHWYWKRRDRSLRDKGLRELSARSRFPEIREVFHSEEGMEAMFWSEAFGYHARLDPIYERLEELGIEFYNEGGLDPVVRYFIEEGQEQLRKHPTYGPYFQAVKDRDIDGQVRFHLRQDTIPRDILTLIAKRYTSEEAFLDYLRNGTDLPPEARIMILESVSMSDLNSNWEWRSDQFRTHFPVEMARYLAVYHSCKDPTRSWYDVHHDLRLFKTDDEWKAFLGEVRKDRITCPDPQPDNVILRALAERGEGRVRQLATLLTTGSLRPDIPVMTRLLEIAQAHRKNPLVVSAVSEELHAMNDFNDFFRERYGKKDSMINLLFDIGEYEAYLEFKWIDTISNHLVWFLNPVIAHYRLSPDRESCLWLGAFINDRIRVLSGKVQELHDAEACNKALDIFNRKLEIALLQFTLGHPNLARSEIDEMFTTIEALIIQCQQNDLPYATLDFLKEKMLGGHYELMTSGIEGLVEAVRDMEWYPAWQSYSLMGPTMRRGSPEPNGYRLLNFPVTEDAVEVLVAISSNLDGSETYGEPDRSRQSGWKETRQPPGQKAPGNMLDRLRSIWRRGS